MTLSPSLNRSNRTFVIAIDEQHESSAVFLPTSCDSAWSRMLGGVRAVDDDALEAMNAAISAFGEKPERVRVVGDACGALFVLLWLRTIWAGPDAQIELEWKTVGVPRDEREILAAQLACALATTVHASESRRTERIWGVRCGCPEASCDDVLDLLVGLLDTWEIEQRRADFTFPTEWAARMRRAVDACADQGVKRVALYGAGTHTRSLGSVLMEPRVQIDCIIDDNEQIHGAQLWGYDIVSRQSAIDRGVEAVILSANSCETKLLPMCNIFRDAGVSVHRLYGSDEES